MCALSLPPSDETLLRPTYSFDAYVNSAIARSTVMQYLQGYIMMPMPLHACNTGMDSFFIRNIAKVRLTSMHEYTRYDD